MLTYNDRFCNLLRYLFVADLNEVTVNHQHPSPVNSESDSSELPMDCNSRDFTKCFRTTTTSIATVSSFFFPQKIYFDGSSKTPCQNWLLGCCYRELVIQQLYNVICFKYYTTRRDSVLTGAHIAVRGRRLTWITIQTRRVLYLSSFINSSSTCIVLYCSRVPAANTPGCTAAEGLLYKPWSLVFPTCTTRCLHHRP